MVHALTTDMHAAEGLTRLCMSSSLNQSSSTTLQIRQSKSIDPSYKDFWVIQDGLTWKVGEQRTAEVGPTISKPSDADMVWHTRSVTRISLSVFYRMLVLT